MRGSSVPTNSTYPSGGRFGAAPSVRQLGAPGEADVNARGLHAEHLHREALRVVRDGHHRVGSPGVRGRQRGVVASDLVTHVAGTGRERRGRSP